MPSAPHFSFGAPKRETGCGRSKEKKTLRRVGPRQRGPPAAGGGRLALPRGNQGRKRAALGVIQARGRRGYSPLLFSLPLTFPRGARADTQVGLYKTMAVSCSPVGADLRVRPLERPFTDHRAAAASGAEAIRFPPRFSAPPDTRRKAGEKERSSASRQKTDGSRRHRFGRPPSARRATAPERGKKAAFSFGPCNRAAVRGSAALRLDSRSRLRRATDVASPLRGDAAYPLRPRPVFFSTRLKRKWGVECPSHHHG